MRKNLSGFASYHLPFGVIVIQVDRLEHFRAAYGPPASDAILRVVAQTMKNAFRPSDFVGRWANDQFLAILINCGDHGVEKTFERIRKIVTCAGLRWWSDELSVTTSVGYASVQAERYRRVTFTACPSFVKPSSKTKIASVLQASPEIQRPDLLCLQLSESWLSSAR